MEPHRYFITLVDHDDRKTRYFVEALSFGAALIVLGQHAPIAADHLHMTEFSETLNVGELVTMGLIFDGEAVTELVQAGLYEGEATSANISSLTTLRQVVALTLDMPDDTPVTGHINSFAEQEAYLDLAVLGEGADRSIHFDARDEEEETEA